MCNFCCIEATSFHQLYLNFPCDTDNFPKEVNIFIILKINKCFYFFYSNNLDREPISQPCEPYTLST